MQTTKCRRCQRQLTNAKSIAAGIGPVCIRYENAEAEAAAITEAATTYGFSADQADKATEVFEDKAIVLDLTGHPHALVVSEDGTTIHRVTAAGRCDCDAAHYGRRCYHQLAALTALQLGQAA